MLHCALNSSDPPLGAIPRVSAVSYLNTLPLVWGFLKGPQQGSIELTFSVPAECAEQVANGSADIGIVPCAELPRLGATPLLDVGIACRGPVRSILLISKVPPPDIRTLAVDASSRTSVRLARIILDRRYGCRPHRRSMTPDLTSMLETNDAALIIGDPALHLEPARLPYHVLDLGSEWLEATGLPMVFAVWAGRADWITPGTADLFRQSCSFGLAHIEDIVKVAVTERTFAGDLARDYLTRHIVFELGDAERSGMDLFLRLSGEIANS